MTFPSGKGEYAFQFLCA